MISLVTHVRMTATGSSTNVTPIATGQVSIFAVGIEMRLGLSPSHRSSALMKLNIKKGRGKKMQISVRWLFRSITKVMTMTMEMKRFGSFSFYTCMMSVESALRAGLRVPRLQLDDITSFTENVTSL